MLSRNTLGLIRINKEPLFEAFCVDRTDIDSVKPLEGIYFGFKAIPFLSR